MTAETIASMSPRHLIDLARGKSLAARASLAASISELYFARSDGQSDRERALMAEILRQLIRDVGQSFEETIQRGPALTAAHASDMAAILGSDNASEVAGLIRDSANLTDEDLVAIIRRRGSDYRESIANRPGLSPTATDALVASGEESVLLRLLANKRARLSRDAVTLLVGRAKDAPAIRALLVERAELSPDQARTLAETGTICGPSKPGKAPANGNGDMPELPNWLRRKAKKKDV